MTSTTVLTHPSTDKVQLILKVSGDYGEWCYLHNMWMHFLECFNWRKV